MNDHDVHNQREKAQFDLADALREQFEAQGPDLGEGLLCVPAKVAPQEVGAGPFVATLNDVTGVIVFSFVAESIVQSA